MPPVLGELDGEELESATAGVLRDILEATVSSVHPDEQDDSSIPLYLNLARRIALRFRKPDKSMQRHRTDGSKASQHGQADDGGEDTVDGSTRRLGRRVSFSRVQQNILLLLLGYYYYHVGYYWLLL